MSGSQMYIGADNGVIVCVDAMRQYRLFGRFYHGYSAEPVVFASDVQLIFGLEKLFDDLCFPYPSTNDRYFVPAPKPKPSRREKRVKTVTDDELLQKRGSLGNFIIKVQHRQNSSWQGRITWIDENKTVSFRSTFEMIKLMENALDTVCQQEEDQKDHSWDD